MTKISGKVFIGLAVGWILIGARSLQTHQEVWGVFSILIGVSYILMGVSSNVGGVRQRITRGFSFGLAGAAAVVIAIWLATHGP